MAKKTSPKPKLPRSWQLFKLSLGDFWAKRWLYIGVTGLVVLPTDFIGAYLAGSSTNAYLALATLFMDVALIYSVVRAHREPKAVFGLRTAYYSSSQAAVRFLIVVLWLAVMLIPFAIGSEIYLLGLGPLGTAPLGELLLLGGIGVVVSIPSLIWITRYGLALIGVVAHEFRPWTALRQSWRMTKGYFWHLVGRYVLFVVFAVGLIIIPVVVLTLLQVALGAYIIAVIIQILIAVTVLPVLTIYSYHLYEALSDEV